MTTWPWIFLSKLFLLCLALSAYFTNDPRFCLGALAIASSALYPLALLRPGLWRYFWIWPLFFGVLYYLEAPYARPDYPWPLPLAEREAIRYRATVKKVYGARVVLVELQPLALEKPVWPSRPRRQWRSPPASSLHQRTTPDEVPSRRQATHASLSQRQSPGATADAPKRQRSAARSRSDRPRGAVRNTPDRRRSVARSSSYSHRPATQTSSYRRRASRSTGFKRARASKPSYSLLHSYELPPLHEVMVLAGFSLRPGCEIEFRLYGRSAPAALENTSFHNYLRSKGARSHIQLRKSYLLREECPAPTQRELWLQEIQAAIFAGLPERKAAVAVGMLTGNYRLLDASLREKARATGVLHLFAASGLHAGILYSLFFVPTAFLWGRKRPLVLVLTLLPPLFYLYLLNFPLSLLRAFSFLLLYALALLSGRSLQRAHLILGSAMLCLLFDPRQFFSVGTAMSFGAVTGILYFYKPTFDLLQPESAWKKLLWGQCSLSISAGLFTLPIIAYFFGSVGQSGLYFNVLLVPLTSILLPLVCLYLGLVFVGPVAPFLVPAGAYVGRAIDAMLGFFIEVVEQGSAWNVENGQAEIVIALAVAIALLLLLRRRGWQVALALLFIGWQFAQVGVSFSLVRSRPCLYVLSTGRLMPDGGTLAKAHSINMDSGLSGRLCATGSGRERR